MHLGARGQFPILHSQKPAPTAVVLRLPVRLFPHAQTGRFLKSKIQRQSLAINQGRLPQASPPIQREQANLLVAMTISKPVPACPSRALFTHCAGPRCVGPC